MKKIITHINPDSDAVTSVWLIKRFLPGWKNAEVEFVKADFRVSKDLDADPNVLFVDVGLGKLDHHQTTELISASHLCWQYLQKNRGPFSTLDQKAIKIIVDLENQIDNVLVFSWAEINEPRYYFYLQNIIDGLKGLGKTNKEVVEFGLIAVDGIFVNLKNQFDADETLKKGIEFLTHWGKGIAVESKNKAVCWRGEVLGYVVVVKKDPDTGGMRIYARSDSQVDLSETYRLIVNLDPESDWYLHQSKKVLLNQASVNPGMKPTKLSLEKIIEIFQKLVV